MSSLLIIEGKEYVPATIARKRFEYSKDYLLLLIKQGKIEGRKIGNKWYVYIPSAESFFKTAKVERIQKNTEVSQIRKAELREHMKVHKTSGHRKMLLETLAVLVVVLAVGSAGNMNVASQVAVVTASNSSFFESIAKSFHAFFVPEIVSTEEKVVANIQSESDSLANKSLFEGVASSTHDALIVAPSVDFTEADVKTLQDSFADPVEVSVDESNPETGIVTPIFKELKGEEYRFLMVPVKTNSQ